MKPKQVIVVGAGHAHLHVVKHARCFLRRGIQIIVVDPGKFWYSGMATGMLAGQYDAPTDQIEIRDLVNRTGGRFVGDRLVGVDSANRDVQLASGEVLGYDALSLNLGSEVADVPIHIPPNHCWPVKPISNLWKLRQRLEERFETQSADLLRVVVIGGGPTGCEVAACIDSLARRRRANLRITLAQRGPQLAPTLPPGAVHSINDEFERRGITVQLNFDVERVEKDEVRGSDGHCLPADEVIVATGLTPPSLLEHLPLPYDDDGLLVNRTLQVVGQPDIFAVGDCAHFNGHRLPKLGVFGVRQGPVLLQNLLAVIDGRQLREYQPQKRYLAIMNLGDGRALATYGNWHWRGRLSYWLKDFIDRRFMSRYMP